MEEVEPGLLSALLLGGHMLLVAGLAVRILFRHLPVGTTLAWLIVLFVLPVFGPALYLFIGENRLGQKRAARWRIIHDLYREWQDRLKARAAVDWGQLHPRAESLASHGESITGFVALQGHELKLLPDWDSFIDALVADIEAAQSTCHLEFYIWDSAGRVGEVYTALARLLNFPLQDWHTCGHRSWSVRRNPTFTQQRWLQRPLPKAARRERPRKVRAEKYATSFVPA